MRFPGGGESGGPPRRRTNVVGATMLVLVLVSIGIITLTPAEEGMRLPFWCFRCGTRAGVDILLNILMFLPLGIALGMLRVRARSVVICIVVTTLAIEALQFAFIPGRFASVRDILANTTGGVTGWALVAVGPWLVAPSPLAASVLAAAAASTWVAMQAFTAWALMVVVPPPPWWAQLRLKDLSFPAVFAGEILRSSLGTVDIRYSDQLEESESVRRQLIAGAELRTVVTGVEPSAGPAPIFLLATNDALSEVAGLIQTRSDVFFRVRTRAADIGLRNPSLRLRNVFPPGSSSDTVALAASHASGRYRIDARRGATHLQRTVGASPSWTWALLVPLPHYSFGAELRWVTAVWVVGPLMLIGFWSGHATTRASGDSRRTDIVALLPASIASVCGLALVPLAFGLPVAHWSEWLAAGVGAVCGAVLGRHAHRHLSRQRPNASPR